MNTKKFRKKPVLVEGIRFTGNIEQISEWCQIKEKAEDNSWVVISTLDGGSKCFPGDWIIKDENGNFSSCKSSIFVKMYEELVDE